MPRSSFYYKEIKRNYHEVKEAILSLYKKNRKRDGYRPMTFKLRQMGFNLNHKTVLKLMNELGIHSILRKKRHRKRGKTSHIAPNLLNRDFTATALNQKWVTDVTEFQVGQEKLYFSPLMDLANREVIAYNFATRPKFSLVKKMLEQGLSRIKPTECPIIHSDQGVLYGSAEWVKMLEGKAVQSMSRRGNCYDNAVIESFFAIFLGGEITFHRPHSSVGHSSRLIIDWSQVQVLLGAPLSPYRIILSPSKTTPTPLINIHHTTSPNPRSVQLIARNHECLKSGE